MNKRKSIVPSMRRVFTAIRGGKEHQPRQLPASLRKLCQISLAGAVVAMLTVSAHAANWYVRPSATGSANGTDWNNAWTLNTINWAGVNPGDTVWLAGGTYRNSMNPTKSGAAGNLIYVRRVLSSDPVPTAAAGWNSAFDSQVIVAPVNAIPLLWNTKTGSYMYFDGRVDSGISFRIDNGTQGSYAAAVTFGYGSGRQRDITFTNIDMAGPAQNANAFDFTSYCSALSLNTWDGTRQDGTTNIMVTHCRLHGAAETVYAVNAWNTTFEYCKFYDNNANLPMHANIWEWHGGGNLTIRYNDISTWNVEGFRPYGKVGTVWSYGNVWHDAIGSVARCWEPDPGVGASWGPLYVYNDTYVNIPLSVFFDPGSYGGNYSYAAGSQIRNCIFWNAPQGGGSYISKDYNYANTSLGEAHGINGAGATPFVNYAGKDYRIVSTIGSNYPRNKGVALSSPYGSDMQKNVRGSDGSWDIGAYEYFSGTTSIAVTPASRSFGTLTVGATADQTFTVQNSSSSTLSGAATVAAPFSIVSGSPYSIAAGQSQVVTVRYSPTAAGTSSQNVTFSGGNGATAQVSGTAQTAAVPVMTLTPSSSLSFGSILAGMTADRTVTVQNTGSGTFSGSATISAPFSVISGSPYNLAAGQSQTVTVRYSPATAGTNTQNLTFTGAGTMTVPVSGSAVVTSSLSFPATAGQVTAPFVITSSYIYQAAETTVANGGRAVYDFVVTNAGNYVVRTLVNAPDGGANSLYFNIDGQPQDPTMIWDIPTTSGFEQKIAGWRGNGTFDNNQYVPKVFKLTAGAHQLVIVAREANVQLQTVSIVPLPAPPKNVRIIP